MGRAPCCDKTKVKRGPWSPEEDNTLKNYLEKNGTGGNWISLPQKAGLYDFEFFFSFKLRAYRKQPLYLQGRGLRRCGKSCRLRWLNYLRPDIKHGGFTEEEDNIILTLYSQIGSRWSVIAANLQGRTDNDVKNHWNTKLKKKLLASQNNTNLITTSSYNFTNINITSSDHDFNDHKFSRNNYYGTLDYYSNTFTSHMDPNSTNYSTCQFPLPALMEIQANDGATIQEDGYNFMDFSSGISSSSSSSYYDDRVVQCKEHSTLVGFGKRSHPRIARCTEHPASAGSREELYPKVAQCTEYFASTEFEKRSHTKECDVYYDDILGNEFDFQENDIGSYYNILEIDQLLKGFDQN